jgi:tetratricopeptide (TPR) repeat protein
MRKLFMLLLLSLTLTGCQTMPTGDGAAVDNYNRGRAAYDAGDYQSAVSFFLEATRLDPRYGEAFYGLGKSYEAMNMNRQALNAYLDAVSVQPSHGGAHARAGILYFKMREYGPAETHLKRATEYAPADPMPFYYLGEIYRMQGNCKASVDMYKKALALNPGLLDAKEGLRRAQREICGGGGGGGGGNRPPKVERATEFTGGGRALKPGEW